MANLRAQFVAFTLVNLEKRKVALSPFSIHITLAIMPRYWVTVTVLVAKDMHGRKYNVHVVVPGRN